jgi:hypothetical protein
LDELKAISEAMVNPKKPSTLVKKFIGRPKTKPKFKVVGIVK